MDTNSLSDCFVFSTDLHLVFLGFFLTALPLSPGARSCLFYPTPLSLFLARSLSLSVLALSHSHIRTQSRSRLVSLSLLFSHPHSQTS